MNLPEYATYSIDELFQALETIDDSRFPERTNTIFKQIMHKTNLNKSELLEIYNVDIAEQLFAILFWFVLDEIESKNATRRKLLNVLSRIE